MKTSLYSNVGLSALQGHSDFVKLGEANKPLLFNPHQFRSFTVVDLDQSALSALDLALPAHEKNESTQLPSCEKVFNKRIAKYGSRLSNKPTTSLQRVSKCFRGRNTEAFLYNIKI